MILSLAAIFGNAALAPDETDERDMLRNW